MIFHCRIDFHFRNLVTLFLLTKVIHVKGSLFFEWRLKKVFIHLYLWLIMFSALFWLWGSVAISTKTLPERLIFYPPPPHPEPDKKHFLVACWVESKAVWWSPASTVIHLLAQPRPLTKLNFCTTFSFKRGIYGHQTETLCSTLCLPSLFFPTA